MNDQQLKQRIAYLLEHGGIAESDPLVEIRRDVRVLYVMLAIALLFHVAEAVAAFIA